MEHATHMVFSMISLTKDISNIILEGIVFLVIMINSLVFGEEVIIS